jgi:hypothetical protein
MAAETVHTSQVFQYRPTPMPFQWFFASLVKTSQQANG